MSSATAPHNGILVAVDGSGCSDDAVRWAAAEAVLRRQKLSIVNIVSPLTDGWYGAGMFGSPITAEFGAWQQDEADKIIAAAVRIARDSVDGADLDISTEVPLTAVVPTLIDFSKQAAMIVLGSRGMGAVGRLLLGSVSTALVHHAHCPVAIIRGPLSEDRPTVRWWSVSTVRRPPNVPRRSRSKRPPCATPNWWPCTRSAIPSGPR